VVSVSDDRRYISCVPAPKSVSKRDASMDSLGDEGGHVCSEE